MFWLEVIYYLGGVSSFFSSGFVSGCVAGAGVGVEAAAASTTGAAAVSVGFVGAAFGYNTQNNCSIHSTFKHENGNNDM